MWWRERRRPPDPKLYRYGGGKFGCDYEIGSDLADGKIAATVAGRGILWKQMKLLGGIAGQVGQKDFPVKR